MLKETLDPAKVPRVTGEITINVFTVVYTFDNWPNWIVGVFRTVVTTPIKRSARGDTLLVCSTLNLGATQVRRHFTPASKVKKMSFILAYCVILPPHKVTNVCTSI